MFDNFIRKLKLRGQEMFEGFMKKLRLWVTILVVLGILGPILCICGFTDTSLGVLETLGMIVVILIMSMLLYAIIYYWYGKDFECPSCYKHFCLKKIGQKVIGKESVSVLVETNIRDRDGNVTGTKEQYVPGERITYQSNYICKKCGEGCHKTFFKDVPKI